MADQQSPGGSGFLKERKKETRIGAVLAFFRERRLESSLTVVVLLSVLVKSCVGTAGKERVYRWGAASLTEAQKSKGQGGIIMEEGYGEDGPPASSQGEKPRSGLPWQQQAAADGSVGSSRARADFAGLPRLPSLTNSFHGSPLTQDFPASGTIGSEPPPEEPGEKKKDSLSLIEKGSPPEEMRIEGKYKEVPRGADGEELVESIMGDYKSLLKELQEFDKKQTWISLEKLSGDVDIPPPVSRNALLKSRWVQEILRVRRGSDAALFCGSSCNKIEKRIIDNRARFYGER